MRRLVLLGVLLLFLFPATVHGRTVALPLSLDFPILTTLLKKQAFPASGDRAFIVGQPGDCIQVMAQEPRLSANSGLLQLEMQLYLTGGTDLGDSCLLPVNWAGRLVLLQKPVLNPRTFSLTFSTVKATLLTTDRRPVTLANNLFEFARPHIQHYLDRVRIELAPPVQGVGSFLQPLFPRHRQESVAAMLQSLRGGDCIVSEQGLQVSLLAEVEEVFEPEKQTDGVQPLSPETIALWETWDAFLVELLADLSAGSLTAEDRQILVEVLLDTRHTFSQAEVEGGSGEDLVRQQFITAWEMLSPLFRRQLLSRHENNIWGYLALFTAADALVTLDSMGPTMGIEISQRGLERLAELFKGPGAVLRYGLEVDGRMRQLLELPPVDAAPELQQEQEEVPSETEAVPSQGPLGLLENFLLPSVLAAAPKLDNVQQWRVDSGDLQGYLRRVRKVLEDEALRFLAKQQIPDALHPMFLQLIPAVAWQESCFRQYTVRDKQLTYLLSYNNSSVGLMQINERVWRGIYNRDRLRWDIRYNAMAGVEIVALYLRDHALRKSKSPESRQPAFLAAAVYAMYNGGPGQYAKYLARKQKNKTFRSDQLFAEKFAWVQNKQWEMIDKCLVGG